ncbi:MAG: DUF4166 domain-containing protein [Caulobacter sp.]|nr:DUF4166 domain-containing protein [Caulobacter sp.]
MRVLIIGGYGVFGARLVRLLAAEPRLTLLVSGRSEGRARALCEQWGWEDGAILQPARLDRDGDVAAQLAALKPDVVVDCSGPFQAYGAEPFRVVEACIAAGVHYLDLADGSDFVLGVEAFNAAARAAGVMVISGASTCPALTAAAVLEMTGGWAEIESISAGIAPSPHAVVGENVLRAITSYAGKPVALRRDGQTASGRGLLETRTVTIAPPGRLPLYSTRFSLVDVPDLTVLPRLWPRVCSIWMGAGPRPELMHRMLNGLAWLVSLGLPLPLTALSGLFHAAKTRLSWGEDRGGMYVEVAGVDAAGRPARRTWSLTADGDHGPFIPSMAAAALVGKLLVGEPPAPGARTAAGALTLRDYAPLFEAQGIVTGVRDHLPPQAPVYQRVLAGAWAELPPAVRAMHDLPAGRLAARGRASVERGSSLLARLVGVVIGFPRAQVDGLVEVVFERQGLAERWTRSFGDQRFASRQFAGEGRAAHLVVEAFGPLACGMAPVLEAGRLRLIPRRWSLFGLALPAWLFPRIEAWEAQTDGRFAFNVAISHPLTGPIVAYRGWLEPMMRDDA